MKKKKKSKKKAAADLEAFEKQLGETKDEDEDDDEADGADMDFRDENDDLGDDIFDRTGEEVTEGVEPWAGTNRDYTYPEVRMQHLLSYPLKN